MAIFKATTMNKKVGNVQKKAACTTYDNIHWQQIDNGNGV